MSSFRPVPLDEIDVPQSVRDSWKDNLTLADLEECKRLVELGKETPIDNFIRRTPSIWSAFLAQRQTGHHGIVVLDQPQIATKLGAVDKGLIPDFLIASKNSDGWKYFVIDLKAPGLSVLLKDRKGWRFSDVVNRGIVQLLGYVDFCTKHQSMLRDTYGFEDFREPRGILIAGRAAQFDSCASAQTLKAAWNRATPTLEIRTYDSLLNAVALHLSSVGLLKIGSQIATPESL